MNILINKQNVTAIIDGKVYTKTCTAAETEEITDLVLQWHKKQTETVKKKILEFLSFDTKTKEELKGIDEKTNKLDSDIKEKDFKIKSVTTKLENPYPNLLIKKDGEFYLKGFEKVQLPTELVQKFIDCKKNKEKPDSLLSFWKLCLLNPDPNARQGLFKYIEKQRLIVTPKGYIVCYRQLVKQNTKGENDALIKFTFEQAVKLRKQRASLSKYSIGMDNVEGKNVYVCLSHVTKKFENFEGQIFGTVSELSELYKNKNFNGEYTDNHTKKMKISLGEAVKIPRKDCDSNPHQTCSSGLHVGTPSFLGSNSFGNKNILVLVNPAHVVAVPYTDAHKMRVCEYFPCYEIELSVIKDLNESKIVTYEDEYCEYEIEQVEKILGSKKFDLEKYVDESSAKNKRERDEAIKRKEELLKRKEELLGYFSIKNEVKDGLNDMEKIRELMKSRTIKK